MSSVLDVDELERITDSWSELNTFLARAGDSEVVLEVLRYAIANRKRLAVLERVYQRFRALSRQEETMLLRLHILPERLR